MTGNRISTVPEDRFGRDDRRWAVEWNGLVTAAERRAGDGLVWHQRGRSWGELVRASTGGHVVYGSDAKDAMRAFLAM